MRHQHTWGKWMGRGKNKHRYCINGWCPKGQDNDERVYVARPHRTGTTALKIAKKKKKKKKKKVKLKRKKKIYKKRVYTKNLKVISSGCNHKNSGHDRFGPEVCDDCGGVMIRVWVKRT